MLQKIVLIYKVRNRQSDKVWYFFELILTGDDHLLIKYTEKTITVCYYFYLCTSKMISNFEFFNLVALFKRGESTARNIKYIGEALQSGKKSW